MARSKKSVNIPIEEIFASLDRLDAEGLELVVKAIQVILQERQPANDRIIRVLYINIPFTGVDI